MQQQLMEVIRHSLNAAQTALEALEDAQYNEVMTCPCDETCETPCVQEVVEEASTPEPTSPVFYPFFSTLMEELNNEEYTLRTVSELSSILSVTASEIYAALDFNAVGYVLRNRRSDGAKLIGLANRN